ncbi:hypothetical protein B7494_g1030 [Chlorociboria aeruginascens]|nr:hypothetical protein B7494_g1030 [Chlorociboria aeruginascens]
MGLYGEEERNEEDTALGNKLGCLTPPLALLPSRLREPGDRDRVAEPQATASSQRVSSMGDQDRLGWGLMQRIQGQGVLMPSPSCLPTDPGTAWVEGDVVGRHPREAGDTGECDRIGLAFGEGSRRLAAKLILMLRGARPCVDGARCGPFTKVGAGGGAFTVLYLTRSTSQRRPTSQR